MRAATEADQNILDACTRQCSIWNDQEAGHAIAATKPNI